MEITWLEITWFVLWGVLWAVYFALDGYDFGIATLTPFLAENERDRRIMYNATGPFWDGNQVWLITAGGVTFAAFPATYAAMFSGLYTALMLLLFALIFRGISFEFRSKVESAAWRKFWDGCHIVGSFLPALLFGVAFANIFMGLPLNVQAVNEGGLLDLLNPYGLAGGVLFVLVFSLHGALWLGIKAERAIAKRAMAMAGKLWVAVVIMLIVFAVAIIGVTMFWVIGMFPALIPSSLDPAFSMTIANSTSSQLTLQIMLGVTLAFLPLVIAYQTWVYLLFGHKITDADLEHEHSY